MGGFGVNMMLPGLMMGPGLGMGMGMGMGGCCDNLLGGQGGNILGGGILGGLAGGLLGGPGGALMGGLGGGILGGILGRKRHHHCHHQHQNQFPPPCGGGFGGYGGGGYGCGGGGGFPGGGYGGGGGFPGMGFGQGFGGGGFDGGGPGANMLFGGGGGQANQAAMFQMMAAQQQMQQTQQLQQMMYGGGGGFQGGGPGADMLFGGGFPGGGQGGPNANMQFGGGGDPYGQQQYFGNNYGIAAGGCMPPGNGWNGGCCPPQHCQHQQQGGGSTGNPGGRLQQDGQGGPINYRTSGGWNVQVNGDKVIITDPTGKQKVEHSGDPHEYVNGKHIKDWEGKDRSIVLPDGTKITMNASGPQGLVEHTSIYDGDQNVQIRNSGNQVESRSFNPYETRMREAWQADGETSSIRTSYDGNKLSYDNLYTQDQNFGVRDNHKHLAGDKGPFWTRPFFGLFGGPRTHDAYNDRRYLFT